MFALRQSPRDAGKRAKARLVDRMRGKGIRLTQQRRVIADLLEQAEEHLDAESVYRRASRRDPRIHRATVYRTLRTLTSLGLLDELDLMHVTSERHYYEVRPDAFHIHLVCTSCGSVQEPSGPFWEKLKDQVFLDTGFRSQSARLEVGGICSGCGGT